MPATGRRKSGGKEAVNDADTVPNGTRNGSPKQDSSKEVKTRLTGKRAPDGREATEEKKKMKTDAEESKEVDEEEDKTVRVEPVGEASDLNAAAKATAREPDSDPEDFIMEETRLASWATFEDDGVDHDFASWSRAIEELRRTRRPEARRGSIGVKITPEDLLKQVRQSLQSGDVANLTAPAEPPRITDMIAVVQQMKRAELLDFLAALAERHESHPRERPQCTAWVHQVLDASSGRLIGLKKFRSILRPLLRAIVRRRRLASKDAEALGCLGKWRMAAGIARVRRRQEDANKLASLASTTSAGLLEEDEEDEEDIDEDEEEEAPASRKAVAADSDSED